MKKVIIAMMLLVGFSSIAQRGERGERGQRSDYKDMTAEQIATLQTKKMTLALDLTESQQKKIQAINLETATTRKAKMAERKANKDKELSTDEKYAMKEARLNAAIEHKAQLKKILTPEQFEKWETQRKKRGMHKKQKRSKKGKERK